jgi:mRNA interferase MazF
MVFKHMDKFVKGEIVVFNFPFSDSAESKKRPALIAANTFDENLILCQITSQARPDPNIIPIKNGDFQEGMLKHNSFIRPTILFTVHKSRINYKAGKLKQDKIKEVEKELIKIFTK